MVVLVVVMVFMEAVFMVLQKVFILKVVDRWLLRCRLHQYEAVLAEEILLKLFFTPESAESGRIHLKCSERCSETFILL
jgi:hypothetical protein